MCKKKARSSVCPSKLLSFVSTHSFVCLYKHTGLVVRVSGEIIGFFGGNGVAFHISGMTHPAVSIPRERGGNLEKKILESSQRSRRRGWRLDCKAIGESLIRVDALAWPLAVEKVGEFDDMRNRNGTADEDNFIDI